MFDVAARDCNDFGEWRFREIPRQEEDEEHVGQAVFVMCCAGFIRLLVDSQGHLSIGAHRNEGARFALLVDATSSTQ